MLRFGLIGVGNTVAIARQHAEALKKLPDVKITALLSRTRSTMETFAGAYCPEAALCNSIEELLELVDCVCICSPNRTHSAYAIAALRAGKHVLCEKPLGGTSEELSELKRISSETALTNLVAYNFRYQAPIKKLHSMFSAGELGDMLWYQEQKGGNRLSNFSVPYEWRMSKASGGGSTTDFCSHMLDHFLFLSGTKASDMKLRYAQMETYVPQRPDGCGGMCAVETEDFTHLCFTAPGNVSVALIASRVGSPCDRLEIVCTKAMISWSGLQPESLLVWRKDSNGCMAAEPEVISCPGTLQQTYDEQDKAFVDACLHGQGIRPNLADGCDLLAVLQDCITVASAEKVL